MPRPIRSILLLALLAALTTPALAQRDKNKDKNPKAKPAVRVVFETSDRVVFRDYYRAHPVAVKPLPPGIAKNLARGKPLPPGIARTRVPDAVLVQLPWRPPGYSFYLVGDRVVLVDSKGLVADILLQIF